MKKHYSFNDFKRASPSEISEFRAGYGILTGSPRGISAFVVYNFLKERFGRPSYLDTNGDRITWEYVLKGPRRYLAVYDWKLHRWGIGIRLPSSADQMTFEERHKYDDEAREDANTLLQELTKYARKAVIPVTKHSYQFIENTYKISYYYGEHFLQSLDKSRDTFVAPELSQSFTHLVSFEDCSEAWAAIMAFMLSVEAIFNIIFEIYLKKEISEDKVLRQHTFRLSLPDKWLLSSSLCTCFEKPLSRKCRGYHSLKRLINIRNNWAHAIVSDEMRIFLIRKDKLVFATKRSPIYREREQAHIYPSIGSLDYTSVTMIKNDTDAIKHEIMNAMKKSEKRKLEKALEQQYIFVSRKGTLIV